MTGADMPPVAVSCGEPAGIGPEIIVKARRALGASIPLFAIGAARHFASQGRIAEIATPAEALTVPGDVLPLLPLEIAGDAVPGEPDPAQAAAVVAAIARGVALVQDGAASALCTAPIHKKALKDGAGFAFPGHTEYLAHLAGADRVVMMLACDALRVVPATIHMPLCEVPGALSATLLEDTIRITRAALVRDFAVPAPRLAVAGLNPHAGEGGAMGREEIDLIAPVLDRLRSEGMDLAGPLSADTMFHAGARARYDAAVAMYHDQALIPIKTLDFSGGVNVTLGLPFIRTSPDHGTAFDIAGQDRADATSMIAALRMAWDMAQTRAKGG
ncbi:4-hydroxythreonine-4-phosphate dehydrogenase PdxA [Rhodobacteraceae bacterium W635]|uniref:4-hydroxythreonine-4-phosphate dehydrogenase PdxA n=1 Tax=Nioella halotolerans TaxID=2303578 RepID=UPI000E3CFE11|nr:4-hydroxythreonine-4-phosphate dehydrogenase PdxA [Rhodobacteraceae bacterium W635]